MYSEVTDFYVYNIHEHLEMFKKGWQQSVEVKAKQIYAVKMTALAVLLIS